MADPDELLGFGGTPPNDYDLRPPLGRDHPGPLVPAVTAVAALVVGFALATGLTASREAAEAQLLRKDQLIELIIERRERADELVVELDGLRNRVQQAEELAAAGVPVLRTRIDEIQASAGLIALEGPGVRMTLADSPTCPPGAYECIIQDRDVQLAVNALFTAGAEAVAVNDQRVVATTAIRGVGQTILANLSVLSAPYQIVAIGDPRALQQKLRASAFWEEFMLFTRDYGLVMEVEESERMTVPRFSGTIGMTARPADDAGDG